MFSTGFKKREKNPLPKETIIFSIFPLLLKVKFQVQIQLVLVWVFLFLVYVMYVGWYFYLAVEQRAGSTPRYWSSPEFFK